MNVEEYMARHHLTDHDLDEMAAPYERGDYPASDNPVFHGSHLDVVGTKKVTVSYRARDTHQVKEIARAQGVSAAEIYRTALAHYLAERNIA